MDHGDARGVIAGTSQPDREGGASSGVSESMGEVSRQGVLRWTVEIGTDGEVRIPLEFVGAFFADRLRWEAERRVQQAPEPTAPGPTGHATVAEFATLMRLSPRTMRKLLGKMTVGVHYLRQGRRVVVIVAAARRLLEERDLLSGPSTTDLAEQELLTRKRRVAGRKRGS